MEQPITIKNLWICKRLNIGPDYRTLAYTKKASIQKLIDGDSISWGQYRKRWGWTCVKVDVTFHLKAAQRRLKLNPKS